MKKEYGRLFKSHLLKELSREFPGFQFEKIKSDYFSPGELVFTQRINAELKLFMVFLKHGKADDKFTVELGWTCSNDFPELSVRPSPQEPDTINFQTQDEYLCRIGSLMGGRDKWWAFKDPRIFKIKDPIQRLIADSTPPDPSHLDAIVLPKVNDVIQKIKVYGVPFFELIIESQTGHK